MKLSENEMRDRGFCKEGSLYKCLKNKAHIWMADIGYCPYCHISSEARVWGLMDAERKEK